ncbi:protein L-Myc-1b isoform X2 [Polypterus senegalus]|uniref:protein L-Myc-1b isoform X2 n=1 Tax=Polypterus senegalus TaxID=55291 RepID=UPI001965853E|nr:protein L-Myc-1b isoform X2 [Polypterus senegalus]
MPGINSAIPRYENWEMDYDSLQHYFYDDHDPEEDFYKSTAPSEDIWKKFELVPTPPMSPSCFPIAESLEWFSHGANQEEAEEDAATQCNLHTALFSNLSSFIIQDCMWSGFPGSQRLEKVVNDHLAQVESEPDGVLAQDSSTAPGCVDPAAVFYSLSAPSKKQASSGSECRTDSDEEIDVVTVESKQNKHLLNVRKPVTITVRADPHDPSMKRFHISIHQQQHNYAAPSPDSYPEEEPQPKKCKMEPCSPPPCDPSTEESSAFHSTSKSTSPQSSDTEDTDKRKTHNYLERKRRNDLRSRFLALRDEIPELEDCPKTPKVVILTKATEYLRELHSKEKLKIVEKKQLKSRQQQLLRRLYDCKRS